MTCSSRGHALVRRPSGRGSSTSQFHGCRRRSPRRVERVAGGHCLRVGRVAAYRQGGWRGAEGHRSRHQAGQPGGSGRRCHCAVHWDRSVDRRERCARVSCRYDWSDSAVRISRRKLCLVARMDSLAGHHRRAGRHRRNRHASPCPSIAPPDCLTLLLTPRMAWVRATFAQTPTVRYWRVLAIVIVSTANADGKRSGTYREGEHRHVKSR